MSGKKEISVDEIQTSFASLELEKEESSNIQKLSTLVEEMKLKESKIQKKEIINKILNEPSLTGKCIMARALLTPQSTDMESICKKELNIENSLNETSGDGSKNGVNYEIKVSLHAKQSKMNFVQIRPDHKIDYYILIAYNMYENDTIGKAHIFKIPSKNLYQLVVKYGGYAHGTCNELGKITHENMIGRGCEYALRCNPNSKSGKSFELWSELLKYEVSYDAKNF